VAIAANELVRAQARPTRPRKTPAPRTPTLEEQERASRRAPTLVWSASPSFAFLPASHGLLWGAGASFGFRGLGASERAFARWFTGPTDAGTTRWFELGLAVDDRVWLGNSVRLLFGADASFSFVRLGDVRSLFGAPLARDAYSGRAGGLVGVDVRAFGPAWIGLHLSPSAVLRPVSFESSSGQTGSLGGFWFGIDLSLQIEHSLLGSTSTNGRSFATR